MQQKSTGISSNNCLTTPKNQFHLYSSDFDDSDFDETFYMMQRAVNIYRDEIGHCLTI